MESYKAEITHLKLIQKDIELQIKQLEGNPKKEGDICLKRAEISSISKTIQVLKTVGSFGGIGQLIRTNIGTAPVQESLFQ